MGVQGGLPKRRKKKCLNLAQATLWGFPAANPTPMKFGTLQDVSLDISGDVKQLYGQKQFPEAVARGKCKITGKSKFAAINGKMLNDLAGNRLQRQSILRDVVFGGGIQADLCHQAGRFHHS